MRILILFFFFSFFQLPLMAQNNSYETRWKRVETAFSKGLHASAEKEILEIIKVARAENNTPQLVKALVNYRISLQEREEESREQDIRFFHDELKNAGFPLKQILHSVLAKLYQEYYEENRWKVLERTPVAGTAVEAPQAGALEKWTATDFYNASSFHYKASLSESQKLKDYSLEQLELIIEKGRNTRHLRPTLYDLLAHEAIRFFYSEEIELTKPAYAFEIIDEKAFAPAKEFVHTPIQTSDTSSPKYRALQLYQELIRFHLNDADPSALADVDILRVLYVHSKSVSANKNGYYLRALQQIADAYPRNAKAALALYYKAEFLANGEKRTYRDGGGETEGDLLQAREIAKNLVERFPGSEAALRSATLLQEIEARQLNISSEKVVLPGAASRALIRFKNIRDLYCKVVPVDIQEFKDLQNDAAEAYKKFNAKEALRSWSASLPASNDYKTHSTEIPIEGLPAGMYALIISESRNFEKGSYTSLSYLRVSTISYVQANTNDGSAGGLYVVRRDSGEPMEGVTVKTWYSNYDYKKRKYIFTPGQNYQTGADGFVKFSSNPSNSYFSVEFIKGSDHLYLGDQMSNYEYQQALKDQTRTFLFTDRSVYRPGQLIHFKGIMLQSKGVPHQEHSLLKGQKAKVTFYNVNREVVQEQNFTTNEFGSYAGTFRAPEGILNGTFEISAEGGSVFVNIEEYKRPKFEVTFDTLRNTYRINDEVELKGLARAFAGNALDGATVKYRVFRQARFPYYWSYYYWRQPMSRQQEIAHGEAVTRADGSFDIKFKAIPDESVNKKTMPVFDYRVEADITDVNGETRSGSTTVSVSWQSLLLRIDAESPVDYNDFNSVHVYSTNLAGTYIPTQVTLRLKKLKAPEKIYRTRLWEKPDLPLLTEAEFRSLFPDDEYENENDYQRWPEEKTVWSKSFTTTKEGLEYLQKTGTGNGWYVLEAEAKDKDGETVIDKKYIRLLSHRQPEALPNEHLLVTVIKRDAQPGETAGINIATPYPKVHLMYALNRNRKQTREWVEINGNKFFDFNITEEDRGGFAVTCWYVKQNRFYQHSEFINVPWTNKELNVEVGTFRDKILPGSEQTWSLKISGAQKEKIAAEVLTTMFDASLEVIKPHNWQGFDLFANNYAALSWNPVYNFSPEQGIIISTPEYKGLPGVEKQYDELNGWGLFDNGSGTFYLPHVRMARGGSKNRMNAMEADVQFAPPAAPTAAKMEVQSELMQEQSIVADSVSTGKDGNAPVSLRSNFAETAFFLPQLRTDAQGNIQFSFTAPEALTRWKMMAFAHSTDLRSGSITSSSVTQKEIMVVPNTPRFFREGDLMVYSAKVTNLSEHTLQGKATLQLINPETNEVVDIEFQNVHPQKEFAIKPGESAPVQWEIRIPATYTRPVMVKTWAIASDAENERSSFSDGEQNLVPVLLNSMLVTETLPLPVRINSGRDFRFEKLLQSANSNTLNHHALILEYTANPAWYAVQALPFLADYPYECAEQTFNRYYANALATHVANSSPAIHSIFENWQQKDSAALLSNLQKNEELKSILLQETPWVLQAKTEAEQKRNLALLFDLNRMSRELERTVRELELMQTPNGGFGWFKGMPDDRFITQYILTGVGRLMHLGVKEVGSERRIRSIIDRALPYVDARIRDDYNELKKSKTDLRKYVPGPYEIQYLYMRSFFKDRPVPEGSNAAFQYYKEQASKYWLPQGKYLQGMTAIAMKRWNKDSVAIAIIRSLRENAIRSEEMGMYWKEISRSYWWYEAPIEAQSVLLEAFREIAPESGEADELKIWLLKNKQTNNWKTTKATADACYALLLEGSNWLGMQPEVHIALGDTRISNTGRLIKQEAGTGYFTHVIKGEDVKPSMGNIHVDVKAGAKASGTTWGAVYWQYFEQLDKIDFAETPLSVKKELFVERNSDRGKELDPVGPGRELHVGDKLVVRLQLRVDRDMEYVHMKDMRAACFEPLNVLSNYKYQGGLGYYESTKDAATHFFFSYLRKGNYIFEYPMFVNNKGDYSNGIASIQCMYAPEFSSHSDGIRVLVK